MSLGALAKCYRDNTPTRGLATVDPFVAIKTEFLRHGTTSLRPEAIEDVLPVASFQQQLVPRPQIDYFLDYFLLHVTGEVDKDRLRKACKSLLQCHTILRSVYVTFRAQLLQVHLCQIGLDFTC